MDDKIQFHNVMKDSEYTPESYLNINDVPDINSLYFVKKNWQYRRKGGKYIQL